jgi:hypothetical protein
MSLRAVVRGGRLVVDEPTNLPEGTVLDLVLDDEEDNLPPEERARLHGRLQQAWAETQAGKARPLDQALIDLRSRR